MNNVWSPEKNAGIMMRWVVSRSHQEPAPLQEAVHRGTQCALLELYRLSLVLLHNDVRLPHFKNVAYATCCYFISACFLATSLFCASAPHPVFENMRRRFPCARSALPVWRHDVQWRLWRAAETCRNGRLQPGALHTTDRSVVWYDEDTPRY